MPAASTLYMSHYQRQRRHGKTYAGIKVGNQVACERRVMTVCSRPGCGRSLLAHGLCQAHYRREWRRQARLRYRK